MSQNFSTYNGTSQHSHAPTAQKFEGLSDSLIFPGPSTPLQQNYNPAWPGPQGWQNHGQNSFNFGLTLQPPPIDTGTYFPNPQEDFVPFEKGADFYEHDNVVTNSSAGPRGPPLTPVGDGEGSDASREQMKSRLQELMRHPAMKRPSSEVPGQPQVQHATSKSPAPKSDANARAAELRAKLLANRGSTPVTPSTVATKPTDPPKGKTNDVTMSLKPADGIHTANPLNKKTVDKVAKAPARPRASDIVPTISSSDQADASTDIDGLFAEARAAVAAKSTNGEGRTGQVETSGSTVADKTKKRPATATSVGKPSETASSESHRRSHQNSTPSSETSELGEIRSDSGKPSRTSNPSATTQFQETKESKEQGKVTKERDRNLDDDFDRSTRDDDGSSKQIIEINGQGLDSRDIASPKAARNVSSSKPPASTPQHLQTPKIDNRQDREGRSSFTQESRRERDNEPVRRQSSTIQDSGNRSRPVMGYQQWVPFDRDKNTNPRDVEGRRTQPPRYDVNESARAAAEYKRELEARRQQAASQKAEMAKDHNRERAEPARDYDRERAEPAKDYSREKADSAKDYNRERIEPAKDFHREKVEPTKDYYRKEKEASQQQMTKKPTNETHQYTANIRANHQYTKSVGDVKVIGRENGARNILKELSEQENHDKVEDVRDWLEMTGYFDVPYRKKVLQRFRKIRALDIERAELEREAQLEFESRSYFARSQSALPRESIDANVSGPSLSPQVVRSFVSKMPPPPVPPKEAADDMGIKIKDSANRENNSGRRANEDGMRSASKHYDGAKISNQTLKRYHEPDDDDPDAVRGRPAEKLARTDTKGRTDESNLARSPNRGREEAWASENHTTRNHERRAANEQRGRNRSPDSRHRSGSPIRGRTFGYDQYIPSQQSRGSPNRRSAQSPTRHGISRHSASAEKPKEVSRTWWQNCDEPDHSTKECPDPITQRDNVAKETRTNDTSRSLSHSAKKYDVKNEEERDYQPLEDEYQNSRSSAGYYHYNHPINYRGRGRGRGGYMSANDRGGYRSARANEGSQDGQNGSGSASLNLEEGDSRYFMIKSWNSENVEIAQRDCTWVTQGKNLGIFTEAYNTCRNVILFFSINNSRAFQGYARMDSLPGDAPVPTWAKHLIWDATPPFRLKWITIAETRFSRVGHLKNALNENQAVLVGRDGQEIERECGRALCELLDEERRAIDAWTARDDTFPMDVERE